MHAHIITRSYTYVHVNILTHVFVGLQYIHAYIHTLTQRQYLITLCKNYFIRIHLHKYIRLQIRMANIHTHTYIHVSIGRIYIQYNTRTKAHTLKNARTHICSQNVIVLCLLLRNTKIMLSIITRRVDMEFL